MKTVSHLQRLLKAITFLLFSVFALNAVAATTYEFISRSTDGLYTGGGSRTQVTPDGRYVVYVSSASGLVTPNAPGYQIYLFDRATHTTELISVSNAGAYGNYSSDYPTVSDDGCRVVFESFSTNLVSGAGSAEDVFVRERCTNPKQTRVVSADIYGYPPGSSQSYEARISGNGRYAAFVTYASSIGGTSCSGCVVRKNLDTGAIDLVSVKANGSLGSGSNPDISYDGSRIAFWSYNFAASGSPWDIYLWDATLTGQQVSCVSIGSNGATQVNPLGSISGVHSPGISGNGRYVAFATGFDAGRPALTAEGGNGFYQIYVKDTQTGALTLASVSPSGALGDNNSIWGGNERPALSYDGRYVAFPSTANNLVTSSVYANATKPLVRDLVANQTVLVADRQVSDTSLGFSSNGRFVAFFSNQTTLDPNFPNTQGVYLADLTPLPAAAAPVSPTGTITTTTPAYTWNAVSNASYYLLADGAGVRTWYSAAQAGCGSGTGACSITGSALAAGSYTWYVQTWNSSGYGPWSSGMSFTVSTGGGGAPVAATLVSPSGAISTATPAYTWNAVSNASYYYLWNGTAATWYSAAQAGCGSGTGSCSITGSALAAGNYTWYVQTWNNYGYGPWSSGMSFTISTGGGTPAAATLVSPSGTITTNTPTYTWNAVSNASYYYLWNGTAATWYSAAQAGCSSGTGTCSVTGSALAAGNYTWYVQTYNSSGVGPWSSGMSFTSP